MNDGATRGPAGGGIDPDAWSRGLNDEQLRAVRHGMRSGPPLPPGAGALCVLAGPGTGKTRVITHRIARLIHADGARPESIVALTFTVKAADEMRERLANLVGPALAERVNAHTFHGFGRVLLRRFGDMLGLRSRWQIIDSAQRKRILSGVILDRNLFPHAAATGRLAEAPTVERFIAACRNRAIFPERCLEHAKAWLRSCEENAAGLDEGSLAAERHRARVFADLATAYAEFERICRERHWLTFDDLLTLPIRLLREHPGVAAICRDDYRHVVVDEFQDVNAAQIELLRLLAPSRAAGGVREPDLCVVGDDDQAIYAFRGATERAFEHVARFWPGFTQVELTANYRSTANVLEVANAVISRAQNRFAPHKRVEARGERAAACPPGGGIEGVILEEDGHAAEVIGAMIRADRAANPGRRWKDYAVIARTNSDLERIGGELELDGLPVRYVRALDVGGDEVVRDLLAWIELLVDPRARWSVQRVLGRPPLCVPTMHVGRWVLEHRAETAALAGRVGDGAHRRGSGESEEPFAEWLARGPGASRDAPPGLRRFLELYAELGAMALREPAHNVILRIIEIVGLAEPAPGEAEDERARARRIAALVAFLRFSRSRIDRIEPPGGLAEFWSYFQDLDEEDRRSLCADEEERIEDLPEVSGEDVDAVTLLSGHKAKGLEFDVVFLPRCRPGGFPARNRAEEESLLPDGLLEEWQRGGSDAAARAEEERRLFYVACTRARERLVMLAKKKKSRGSTIDFFQELTLDETGLVTLRDAADVLAACGASPPPPSLTGADGALMTTLDPGRRLGSRLRREARERIGALTLRAEMDGLDTPEVAAISGEMGETAARLALAAHVERYGRVPAWALAEGSPIAEAARLVQARLAGGESPAAMPLLRPMRPPLRLSYSAIESYERCPRCFYLAEILGLAEDAGPAMLVGQAAHAALDRFYRVFREADASGGRPPTCDDLVRFGLEELAAVWPRSRPIDPADQDRLAAQLRLYYEKLHDPTIHVLEIEAWSGFTYVHNGVEHRFSARLDRVDQLPDGGIRIVDYKTGQATKRLREPAADDLQLGVYALAARSLLGGTTHNGDGGEEPVPLRGRAEYWILSTGTRGTIDLASIDEAAIRARIDAAIEGMLEGRFPRGESCEGGACAIFGLDD